MPTCDYCGFTVPDPCYSFAQMAQRGCPVLTVPVEPKYDGRSKRTRIYYTVNEGDVWTSLDVHSVNLPDGSIWDAVNGWRCTAPAPGSQPSREGQPSMGALPKVPKPTGPPLEAPPPNLKNSHWDIWKKGYVQPKPAVDPWGPNPYMEALVKAHAAVAPPPGQCVYADIPKSDPINHPHHYARWAIEPIEFISLNKLPAWLANVIKYSMRYDAKDGLKDLYKARSYLDMEIRRLEGVERFWEVPVAEERRLNAA